MTDLDGVDVRCNPPELSVKLQDSNDTHTYQWTFTLVFKVSKIGSGGKRIDNGTREEIIACHML